MRMILKFVTVVSLLVILGSPAEAGGGHKPLHRSKVSVMTQNLYIGADVFRILLAETPERIPFIVEDVFQTVLASDFSDRAATLAQAIKRRRPDLIGLQEVSLITRFTPGQPSPQVLDYLAELMQALEDVGARYEVVGLNVNTEVELPAVNPLAPGGLDLVRLVDRDVVLARKNVRVSEATSGNYRALLQIPFAGGLMEIKRGFTTVKATVRGRSYRFVNTHLEVQGAEISPQVPFVQAQQAAELLEVLRDEILPVILVGDFNSSPADPVAFPLVPPYAQIRAADYVDTWTRRSRRGRPNPGFTCCQEETLTNAESILSERIDFVFVRNPIGRFPISIVGPVLADLFGDEPAEKTPSGLWPSDHAGLTTRMRIPLLHRKGLK